MQKILKDKVEKTIAPQKEFKNTKDSQKKFQKDYFYSSTSLYQTPSKHLYYQDRDYDNTKRQFFEKQ